MILFCDWKLFRTMDWTQRSTTCVQLTTLLLLLLLLLLQLLLLLLLLLWSITAILQHCCCCYRRRRCCHHAHYHHLQQQQGWGDVTMSSRTVAMTSSRCCRRLQKRLMTSQMTWRNFALRMKQRTKLNAKFNCFARINHRQQITVQTSKCAA